MQDSAARSTAQDWQSILRQRIVWFTAAAAIIPALLAFALYYASTRQLDFGLLLLLPVSLVVGFLLGIANYNAGYDRTQRVLQNYIQALQQVEAGDLRTRLALPSADAGNESAMLHTLGEATNRVLDMVQEVVKDFSVALGELETSTQEILNATQRQSRMGNEQDAVVNETTATVNEVRATVTETAERAQSVAETAQLSVDISRNGLEAVQETVEGMEVIRRRVEDIADNILVLSEQTQQIGEIIATVNNLADQSRMLALNASVEAARAGEEGKGFAVVAMEVRNLADQNRDATVQVREILGEIQRATNRAVMVTEEGSKGVDSGQQQVNKAGEAIEELSRAIEEAALAAIQIAASTRQQTIGVDQLTDAMRSIKHATAETVGGTIQVQSSVNRLREVAEQVNRVLDRLQYEQSM